MKLRLGFVSNSSNTSFCIMGAALFHQEEDEIREQIKTYGLDKTIDVNYTEYGGMCIGLEIEKMQEDETLGQFRSRAKLLLEKLGISENPEIIVEGYYNG